MNNNIREIVEMMQSIKQSLDEKEKSDREWVENLKKMNNTEEDIKDAECRLEHVVGQRYEVTYLLDEVWRIINN